MHSLSDLIKQAESEISGAVDLVVLDAVRVRYLGKKGELTVRLKGLSKIPVTERPVAGQEINKAKKALQERINARRELLQSDALVEKLKADAIDVTLPGLSLIHI